MKSFLFLFSIIGCCVGQDLLPEGPVEAVLRKNVTFKTLVDLKDDFITFVWFFNRGSELVPIVTLTPTGETVAEDYQGRVRVNRTNGFLTLGPLKKNDRGYYNATMVTSKMKKTGETMLRFLGGSEWYALPEGPVDAVSGENVTFKTLIDPKEDIDGVAWFFTSGRRLMRVATASRSQETIVFEAYQGRVMVNQTNGFLTLGPLATKDSGDFHINIFTAKGVKTGETTLRVLEPVSNVTIWANVSETVEFNSTVVLTCSAKGSFPKFSWTSGTAPVMANNTRLAIKEEATSSTLTISGIQSSDLTGPIYCTAANQLGMEKSPPLNLTVVFPPPPCELTSPTQPGKVRSSWSVTFENLDPCALKGSSVQFRCSYNYPDGETVHKTEWFRGEVKDGRWKRTELSSLPSYQNRVKYLGDREHNSSLEIYDLQDSDTGYYYFRFDTDTYGWHSKRSVYLSLTDLTASVKPDSVREGQNVTLTCETSCKLPGPSTIVWFRNGRPVSKPPQFQAGAEDAGNYTCAVEGQESVQSDPVLLDVQYAPVNVFIKVSHNGSLAKGSSVNLTCSSAANPAAGSYTWYKRTVSSSLLQVSSGQVLSFPSVELSNTGLYICQARNRLGENNSTEVLLEVDNSELTPTGPPEEEQRAASSHTTVSLYTDTTLKDRATSNNQDFLDIQSTWFDKLQAELVELRLSFERSLRQMESRTHSLLWSMSRRLERMTEAMDHNSASAHQAKTYFSLSRLLSGGASSATPPSQPPDSRPMSVHTRGQRRHGGHRGNRS